MLSSLWFWFGAYLIGVLVSIFMLGFLSDDVTGLRLQWALERDTKLWELIGLCIIWPLLVVLGGIGLVVFAFYTAIKNGFSVLYIAGARFRAWIENKIQDIMHSTYWTSWMSQ